MPWYAYAFLAIILFSFVNLVDKFLVEHKTPDIRDILVTYSSILGLFGIISHFLLKPSDISVYQIFILVFSGLIQLGYIFPYFEALKRNDPSRVIPLFQLVPLYSLIFSFLLLGETLTNTQILGLVIVVIASYSISSHKSSLKDFKPNVTFALMTISSILFALSGIMFRIVAKDASYWSALSYQFIGVGIGGVILFVTSLYKNKLRDQISILKKVFVFSLVANILTILAIMSENYALSLAQAPLVSIVGSTQPVIVLILGLLLTKYYPHILKEDNSSKILKQKILFLVIMFAGLYLVYLY